METKQEIREFLTSRRARITPGQAGLTTYGARRVPGLRREEVAVLAGVSIQYYTRLERGDMSGASEGVLEGLARADLIGGPRRDALATTDESTLVSVLDRAALVAAITCSRPGADPPTRAEVDAVLAAGHP